VGTCDVTFVVINPGVWYTGPLVLTDQKLRMGSKVMTDTLQDHDAVHEESCDLKSTSDDKAGKDLLDHDKLVGDRESGSVGHIPSTFKHEDEQEKRKELIEYTNPIDHGWSWMIVIGKYLCNPLPPVKSEIFIKRNIFVYA